jgi:hypothetical protein
MVMAIAGEPGSVEEVASSVDVCRFMNDPFGFGDEVQANSAAIRSTMAEALGAYVDSTEGVFDGAASACTALVTKSRREAGDLDQRRTRRRREPLVLSGSFAVCVSESRVISDAA